MSAALEAPAIIAAVSRSPRREVIGAAELWLGDCLDVMPQLPHGYIDLVLCDPPYGTTRNPWDSMIELAPLWEAYRRITKFDAAVVLTAQTPFDKILGASNLDDLRYEWIWEKTEATGHLNATKMPMKAHENILVFYRSLPFYCPQKTRGHERKVSRADRDRLQSSNYGLQKGVTFYDSTDRYPRSVLTFSTDKQTESRHSTQKPVALFAYFIRTYTRVGALVLDNCMGSGTTGVACAREGRRFVGIEKYQDIFDIACQRIEDAQRQSDLFVQVQA